MHALEVCAVEGDDSLLVVLGVSAYLCDKTFVARESSAGEGFHAVLEAAHGRQAHEVTGELGLVELIGQYAVLDLLYGVAVGADGRGKWLHFFGIFRLRLVNSATRRCILVEVGDSITITVFFIDHRRRTLTFVLATDGLLKRRRFAARLG